MGTEAQMGRAGGRQKAGVRCRLAPLPAGAPTAALPPHAGREEASQPAAGSGGPRSRLWLCSPLRWLWEKPREQSAGPPPSTPAQGRGAARGL